MVKPKVAEEKKGGLPVKTFYTVAEVAEYICCSVEGVRRACKSGSMDWVQPLHAKGKFMIPRSELLRILTGRSNQE